MEPNLRKLDANVNRCEALAGKPLGEELAVTVLTKLCVKQLRDRRVAMNEGMPYLEVNEDTASFTERRCDTSVNGPASMMANKHGVEESMCYAPEFKLWCGLCGPWGLDDFAWLHPEGYWDGTCPSKSPTQPTRRKLAYPWIPTPNAQRAKDDKHKDRRKGTGAGRRRAREETVIWIVLPLRRVVPFPEFVPHDANAGYVPQKGKRWGKGSQGHFSNHVDKREGGQKDQGLDKLKGRALG